MGLVDAAVSGNELATLEALRDELAAAVVAPACLECGGPSKRDMAALSGRLVEVLTRISELGGGAKMKEGTPKDEVEQRRRKRMSGA